MLKVRKKTLYFFFTVLSIFITMPGLYKAESIEGLEYKDPAVIKNDPSYKEEDAYFSDTGNAQVEDRIFDLARKAYGLPVQTRDVEGIIFVGDSRVVGMQSYAGGYEYIGEISTGYPWLISTAQHKVAELFQIYPGYDIVMCFGVNDPGNISSYIQEYYTLQTIYKDHFWIMSVNPIYDAAASANGYFIHDSQVEAFNERMQAAFPDIYLDVYSMLGFYGYETLDGIHYAPETYVMIQEICREMIEEKLWQ